MSIKTPLSDQCALNTEEKFSSKNAKDVIGNMDVESVCQENADF